MNFFEKLAWVLFGETKVLVWFIVGNIIFQLVFWGVVIFVMGHFVEKYW